MTTNKKEGFDTSKRGRDRASLRHSLANRLIYSMGKDPITATHRDWFYTTAYAVRERLIERWMETMRSYYRVRRQAGLLPVDGVPDRAAAVEQPAQHGLRRRMP